MIIFISLQDNPNETSSRCRYSTSTTAAHRPRHPKAVAIEAGILYPATLGPRHTRAVPPVTTLSAHFRCRVCIEGKVRMQMTRHMWRPHSLKDKGPRKLKGLRRRAIGMRGSETQLPCPKATTTPTGDGHGLLRLLHSRLGRGAIGMTHFCPGLRLN